MRPCVSPPSTLQRRALQLALAYFNFASVASWPRESHPCRSYSYSLLRAIGYRHFLFLVPWWIVCRSFCYLGNSNFTRAKESSERSWNERFLKVLDLSNPVQSGTVKCLSFHIFLLGGDLCARDRRRTHRNRNAGHSRQFLEFDTIWNEARRTRGRRRVRNWDVRFVW